MIASAVLVGLAAACSSPNANDRFLATMPDRASFAVVADALEHRCGSLDCHGTIYRNLRIYGHEGLRLDPNGRPSSQPNTTTAEYDADYQAVVGLEPEILSAVVSSGGQGPERLTLVRKALGLEAHKGGTLWTAGDVQDTCFRSWLTGATDVASCQAVLNIP
ncbi:MAG: hypothetical protein ACHREM_03015 [Polyangiales bacterium]